MLNKKEKGAKMIAELGADMKTNLFLITIGAAIGLFLASVWLTFFGIVLLTVAIVSLDILLFIRQKLADTSGPYAEFLFVTDLTGGLVICMWLVSFYKMIG